MTSLFFLFFYFFLTNQSLEFDGNSVCWLHSVLLLFIMSFKKIRLCGSASYLSCKVSSLSHSSCLCAVGCSLMFSLCQWPRSDFCLLVCCWNDKWFPLEMKWLRIDWKSCCPCWVGIPYCFLHPGFWEGRLRLARGCFCKYLASLWIWLLFSGQFTCRSIHLNKDRFIEKWFVFENKMSLKGD